MSYSIPAEKISEIKHSADILEIISDAVVLKKAGRNFLGLCPFHSEKTPSFTVSQDKQMFYCFGC
ncbi:MAG: CHC2 zinc finger domain-containing protein, partial [Deltaproteobacteria bacterium]